MTQKLNQLYSCAMEICTSNIADVPSSENGGPANPLLIELPVNYYSSHCKVMYSEIRGISRRGLHSVPVCRYCTA